MNSAENSALFGVRVIEPRLSSSGKDGIGTAYHYPEVDPHGTRDSLSGFNSLPGS